MFVPSCHQRVTDVMRMYMYTVIHKIGTLCIFTITFSNVDRFERNYISVFVRKFAFRRCGLHLHIS